MIATLEPSPRVPVPSEDPMTRLRETLSPSRLTLWLSCRLKFWFRYVRRIVKPPTPSMFCGTIAHAVLQRWNVARWRREPFDSTHWQALFNTRWKEDQVDKPIAWQDGLCIGSSAPGEQPSMPQ